jgi:aryl-alcohol dehydrogenase-like predicted oxidoreductase
MQIRIGESGLSVNPVGVGTNRWGVGGVAHPELRPVFDAAVAAGLGFFDSAEVYGRGGSESTLGLCLQGSAAGPGESQPPVARPPVARPPVAVPPVATKFFPFPWRLRRAALIAALRSSLARLQLRQVELYLIHFPLPPVSIETWMEGLADAVEAGLARAVGVSNFDASQMRRARAALGSRGVALACNQVEYSLLNRRVEHSGLLSLCHELGVTPIAYRPLSLGFLSGHGGAGGWRGLLFGRRYEPAAARLVELIREIGAGHGGKSPAQVALNWVTGKGVLAIPGAASVEHVRENAGALGWRLSREEMAALEAAADRLQPPR